jgi:hypothetical protein
MREARPSLRTLRIAVLAILVLLVALSPTLLFGQSLSAVGLLVTGGLVLGVGLFLRWQGGTDARLLGVWVAISGGVILAFAVGLTFLLLAGRP